MPTPSVASLYNYYSPHIVVVLLPPVAKSSIVRGTEDLEQASRERPKLEETSARIILIRILGLGRQELWIRIYLNYSWDGTTVVNNIR